MKRITITRIAHAHTARPGYFNTRRVGSVRYLWQSGIFSYVKSLVWILVSKLNRLLINTGRYRKLSSWRKASKKDGKSLKKQTKKDEQLQRDEQFSLGDSVGRGESNEVHTIR